MAIVKVLNKKNGITYVYDSVSYWDPEKKQPRNKRKLIGKLDPQTGEMVPTGQRGRKPKDKPQADPKESAVSSERLLKQKEQDQKRILELNQEIAKKNAQIVELEKEVRSLQAVLCQMKDLLEDFSRKSSLILKQ